MSLTHSEQREIMRKDRERREQRESQELAILMGAPNTSAPEGVDPYHYSRSITGQPVDRHRVVRVAPNSWTRGLSMHGRTVGVAPGSPETTTAATVRVIGPDGATTIRPASAFRLQGLAAKHATQRKALAAQRKNRMTAADLPAIGDSNH